MHIYEKSLNTFDRFYLYNVNVNYTKYSNIFLLFIVNHDIKFDLVMTNIFSCAMTHILFMSSCLLEFNIFFKHVFCFCLKIKFRRRSVIQLKIIIIKHLIWTTWKNSSRTETYSSRAK